MVVARSSKLRAVLGLLLVGAFSQSTAHAQDYLPEITNVGFGSPRYTVSVHGIAAVELDYTGSVFATPIASDSADMNGWGVEAATFGQRVSWLIGYDERTIEDDVDFVEVYGGAKLNLKARGNWAPYFVGTLRYSQDLQFPTMPPSTSDDFFGWAAGAGVAYHSTDRFFVEARVTYEGILGDIDARMGRDIAFHGVVATIGAGFTF